MALNEEQQILELVNKSKSILIVFKSEWSGDDLAGALALSLFCHKIGKFSDIICQDFRGRSDLPFLPQEMVSSRLKKLQKFTVSLNLGKTKIDEFYYQTEGEKLKIYITPKEGQFESRDVETSLSDYKYDLIFTINSPDLESLGEVYAKHADFFYATPKINIDHQSQNERFGNLNLVTLTNSSTSETIYDLLKSLDEKMIEGQLATCLLAGMIMATKNFKTANISPKTLNIASLLVSAGAAREQIVQSLYQSRKMATLKLWGRVLTRLNSDLDGRLVWSRIGMADFLETGASPETLEGVIEELIVSLPKTQVVVLFYEKKIGEKVGVQAVVYSANHFDVLAGTRIFNSIGNISLARIAFPALDLAEAENVVTAELKRQMQLV
jgi:phosphoesterase RecJ-like protein